LFFSVAFKLHIRAGGVEAGRNFAFVLKEWRLKTGKAAQRCFCPRSPIEHHRFIAMS
jgi:hypothetical protein